MISYLEQGAHLLLLHRGPLLSVSDPVYYHIHMKLEAYKGTTEAACTSIAALLEVQNGAIIRRFE